jgi:putative ABC transport system permease protein
VLTETVLMAAIAGTIGLLVAWWSTRLAALVQPPSLTSQAYEVLDWRVLGFSAALTLITGVIFGVGPAVYAVRGCFAVSSRTATPSTGQGRASGLLVAAQMTITIVLLTGSLALGRTFVGLLQVNPGFDVRPLVSLHVSFAGAGYEGGRAREYYLEAIQRMRQVPGVVAASATQFLPLASGAHMASRFTIDSTGPETLATFVPIAPEYFRTLGTRVLAGREFTPSDLSSGESIVIINEELARVFGHPASAVGRRLVDARSARTIVGVVQGMRDSGPTYAPEPQAFVPSRSPASLIFVARVNGTTGAARDYLAPIRAAVAAVDPKVPVFDVKTMDERLDETLARPKVYATSVIFFGGLALLMAIVGLHGVVAHAVARRTREMAIRLALGTTPRRLRSRVLGRALGWVLLGAIPGIAVTLVSGGYLRNLIRGADGSLVATCAAVSAGTFALAAFASWWGSHRVSQLEIMSILRVETGD